MLKISQTTTTQHIWLNLYKPAL